ncbi:iron-sulfur cluster-binding protein [Candidatus Rhodobacter oscarellae]|uniref:Iron-sulfur cluster-binding protein n=1 Tax=Candidatus Rhodobacter oscarellae TaxID=1675527 RepID=A0A0J9ED56_9RHOB|nr:4Fe-4S dicluster domain-containing protein [Candidatus Rhodobacter lobularis]KMW60640.1 iron-sulfur cluster-binding protein [Candidatus Rhodobacter lobularis]
MSKPNPYRPFTPDPDQMTHWPGVSGNAINGLGEAEPRQASMVYWAPNPDDIPHGGLQRWFYGVDHGSDGFAKARVRRHEIFDRPLPPLAPQPVTRTPQAWTDALSCFVDQGFCEKVGVAAMQPEWVFEGHEIAQSRVIIAGVQHDYSEIARAPDAVAGVEVMRQYNRAADVAKKIASWLREQGWDAEPVTGPMTGALAMIPPALASGFGELGKHGSIIDREMGASFRLSAVLTDAPFAPTPRDVFGADEFCQSCRICEDACPPEALSPIKQTVRGVDKWYVDFDRCLPFFNQTAGCAICIAVCPWSRPGVGPNLAAKLARRAERQSNP